MLLTSSVGQSVTPSRHSFQMAEVAISGQRSRRFADLLRRVENCYHSFQHQRSSGGLLLHRMSPEMALCHE